MSDPSTTPDATRLAPDDEPPLTGRRLHRAWWVALIILLSLAAAAGFRSSTGVMFIPLENEFGWSRTTTSGAVTLNLIIYGLTAPFAAAVMERFGIRRVVTAALVLVAIGSLLTTVMTQAWQLWVLWGLVIGASTGSMALVLANIVANRWFVRHRGLVTGIFGAANATGQLIFLPGIAALVEGPGWRWAAALVGGMALLLAPIVYLVVADHPQDVGWHAYGAPPSSRHERPPAQTGVKPARLAIEGLLEAARTRSFWLLFGSFWVCGWSTNGLIGTHFIPAAHDHGMTETTAAGLLAMIGIFDIIGTVASGYLTDRVDPRILLFCYYFLRGLSLLVVPQLLGPDVQPNLFIFIIFYGLDWVATVPPTIAICRTHFGLNRSGIVFGWVFASHMVGAGIAASFAGWIRESQGDYLIAWFTAGGLCMLAAAGVLMISKRPESRFVDPQSESRNGH